MHQSFVNVAMNGNLKPGATKTFGFNAKGAGLPRGCTVNGGVWGLARRESKPGHTL